MQRTDPILPEIEAFLNQTGMTPTVFGREVMSDPNFVWELRAGRRVFSSTADRVREQIGRHRVTGSFARRQIAAAE